MTPGWVVERLEGGAGELHARPFGPDVVRRVGVLRIVRPAIVLGSTQPDADVDAASAAALGVELARRRSGGGAVLLVPDEFLWVDVDVPRDDPLWDDDVGRAFHWLGAAWVDALHAVGVDSVAHVGPLRASRWSRRVCFAGLGPGEVTDGGRKVVGIAQRRTRDGARFQSVVLRRWDPVTLARLLGLDETVAAELEPVAMGIGADTDALLDALLDRLPPA